MSNEKTINGRNSDAFCRDRLADISRQISPMQDNDGRMAYARCLLDWVMTEPDVNSRYCRTQGIEQAFQAHRADRPWRDPITLIGANDFLVEADKYARFIRGES